MSVRERENIIMLPTRGGPNTLSKLLIPIIVGLKDVNPGFPDSELRSLIATDVIVEGIRAKFYANPSASRSSISNMIMLNITMW